jgi:iduronate 2-sulfatase
MLHYLYRTLFVFVLISGCDSASETAVNPGGYNIFFVLIDDLRNDLTIHGSDYLVTPNLDAFASQARVFSRHYVQVPTCGSSRAALLRGQRATEAAFLPNSAILDTHENWAHRSLPAWFRKHGYQTFSLGKVTHYPGGLTGEGWATGPEELPGAWDRLWLPESPWQTPEAMMHGFANGKPRERGDSPAWEAHDGPDTSYPDAWVANEAITALEELAKSEQPWFFTVGFFKPHLPFAAPLRYFELYDSDNIPEPDHADIPASALSWHGSGELMNNYGQHPGNPNEDSEYARQLRHAYISATAYVDAQIGRVLDKLEEIGLAEKTIIVIWSDHGFALGEQGIWGKHSLYETALKAPLIIRYPGMKEPGVISDALVETIDIFPTLTDLAGIASPDELEGMSLKPILKNPKDMIKDAAFAHWTRGQSTIRTDEWRLIIHRPEGQIAGVELFDFRHNTTGVRVNPDEYRIIVDSLLSEIERM